MGWDTILEVLGTSGGLLVVLNWIINIPVLRKKGKLEKEDVSRHMAERDNETIINLYDAVRNLQEEVAVLAGIVTKLKSCKYWNRCPSRVLVQDYERKYFYPHSGQSRMEQKGFRFPRDHPGEPGRTDSFAGQPP